MKNRNKLSENKAPPCNFKKALEDGHSIGNVPEPVGSEGSSWIQSAAALKTSAIHHGVWSKPVCD